MYLPLNENFFNRKNLLTRKKIGWGLIVILALWGGVLSICRPIYIANKIYDIQDETFCDTIVKVFYAKDDYGPFTSTFFKGKDTPYCFNGTRIDTRMLYSEFAEPGDVLIKKRRTDTFLIKRRDSIIKFSLSLCGQYFGSSESE